MKVAILSHFYPPDPCGGAGYYTAMLAEAMQEYGHQVGVLCVSNWGEGKRYLNGHTDDTYNGVPVRRLQVNWQKAERPLDWLYDSPVMGEQTRAFLQQYQPDVVHVSSTYTLSARSIFVAKEMDFPVVVHLHDYWFVCARTVLLHKDGHICTGPETPWKCQQCLLAGTKLGRLVSATVPQSQRRRFLSLLSRSSQITGMAGARGMLGDLERRRRVTLNALEQADALITPTNYARQILEANGAPKNRVTVMPNGGYWNWTDDVRRTESDHLRVGFLGNVIPTKGVHVLIEAYTMLKESGASVELQIWGDVSLDPDYYGRLRQHAPDDISWGGRYVNSDLAAILSNLDVIVVPSVWHETQGIVIQEAFAAGLPVLVSADTSLVETVTSGKNGLHFKRGSADDLARQIRRLLDEPALLPTLRSGIPAVRKIDEDVQFIGRIYSSLTGKQREGSKA
jgi:glycosyltransferase involved in cell wall biosynthesis